MANSGKNSNSSQFFVVLTDDESKLAKMSGKHVVFGQLKEGSRSTLMFSNAMISHDLNVSSRSDYSYVRSKSTIVKTTVPDVYVGAPLTLNDGEE
jgi:cyclophilin family peptidyl-prolyl cis-trans isomerase